MSRIYRVQPRGSAVIHHGDLFDVLPTIEAESIDSCVTDPPYGIGFMGREWDTFKPAQIAATSERLRRKGTVYKKSERWPDKSSKTFNSVFIRKNNYSPKEFLHNIANQNTTNKPTNHEVRSTSGFGEFTSARVFYGSN
jgi:hypothetical protein